MKSYETALTTLYQQIFKEGRPSQNMCERYNVFFNAVGLSAEMEENMTFETDGRGYYVFTGHDSEQAQSFFEIMLSNSLVKETPLSQDDFIAIFLKKIELIKTEREDAEK